MYYTHQQKSYQPLIDGLGDAYKIAAEALNICQSISRSTHSIMQGSGSQLGETMNRCSTQATDEYINCISALTKASEIVQSRQTTNKY